MSLVNVVGSAGMAMTYGDANREIVSKNIDRIDVDGHVYALELLPHHHRLHRFPQRRAMRRAQQYLVAPHALDPRQRRRRGALDARLCERLDRLLQAATAVHRGALDVGQLLAAEED